MRNYYEKNNQVATFSFVRNECFDVNFLIQNYIKKETKLIKKLWKDVKQNVDTNIVEMQVFKLFLLTK